MKLSFAACLFGVAIALVVATALIPGSVSAANTSGTLTSTATVVQNCTVTDQTLAFGNYDPIVTNAASGADLTSSATVSLNCTKGSTGVYLTANQGANHANASGTTRAMADGTNYLSYELYTDSGHSNIWDTTDNGTNDYHPDFTATSSLTETVYGLVPKGQDAVVGSAYTDAVLMYINF